MEVGVGVGVGVREGVAIGVGLGSRVGSGLGLGLAPPSCLEGGELCPLHVDRHRHGEGGAIAAHPEL